MIPVRLTVSLSPSTSSDTSPLLAAFLMAFNLLTTSMRYMKSAGMSSVIGFVSWNLMESRKFFKPLFMPFKIDGFCACQYTPYPGTYTPANRYLLPPFAGGGVCNTPKVAEAGLRLHSTDTANSRNGIIKNISLLMLLWI